MHSRTEVFLRRTTWQGIDGKRTMADQESKDFSDDIADQSFAEQNGDAENGGAGGDATENSQESQEDR